MENEEIEKIVLFSIIYEKAEYEICENDFTTDRNKKIARAIVELRKEHKEITMLNVQNKIKANKKQVIDYIATLGDNIYGFDRNKCYEELINLSKKRMLFQLLKESIVAVPEEDDISLYSQALISSINKITEKEEKETTFVNKIAKTTQEIEHNWKNRNNHDFDTGIFDLDNKTGGLHKQELTIVGARPGMGKTTFTLQIAQKIARKNKNVLFVSLEMSETQLIQKMISRESNIDSYKMRMGYLEENDFKKISQASVSLSSLKLNINTKIRTIQKLELEARRLKNKGKLDLIVIDYIQLLKSSEKYNSREQEVAEISRRLKLMSLELDIPIIALCQLNRNANTGEPTLADLRESGSLEQDADNIIFIYRENENDTETTLKLAKQRAGDTGKIKVRFDKQTSTFRNLL